jgi:hypothetical protein
MPDSPETPVANPESVTQVPENPGPSTAEVLAALQQERQTAAQREQEMAMLRQQRDMAWTQRPAAPQAPAEDPTRAIFNDAITDPNSAADRLRQYVGNASEEAAQRAAARERQMSDQRMQAALAQSRMEMTVQSAVDRFPDLTSADKMPQFVGEVAKVKAIYEAQGLPQSPSVYIQKAGEALRRAQAAPTVATPPHVQGAGGGAFAGNPAQGAPLVPQQNPLEKIYKMPAGTIVDPPIGEEAVDEEVKKFILAENAEREKHNVMPAYSEIVVRG